MPFSPPSNGTPTIQIRSPASRTDSDWLDNLIRIVRLLVHAGDSVPIPYIKAPAGIALSVLEAIQVRIHELQHP